MYHREADQENMLVLSGECILLIEGEEIPLKTWDFVHCPPQTSHVFVGAGEGPCAILMVGGRTREGVTYPVADVALKHGAGVKVETNDPPVAYADYSSPIPVALSWPLT